MTAVSPIDPQAFRKSVQVWQRTQTGEISERQAHATLDRISRGNSAVRGRFGATWFSEITFDTQCHDLVKGLLPAGGMSILFGEAGCGKSFFACDLALHIALGRPWRGKKVQQGATVYIAAEGGSGVKKRLVAFRDRHGLAGKSVPFVLIPSAVDLLDRSADVDDLVAEIEIACEVADMPVRLVVIDTLSRVLAGGNENDSADMGGLVQNVDAIRQATGAAVLIVHHSGKDASQGARGHSLLRAACDTEIAIERDKDACISTAKVTKQRDGRLGDQFAFRLDQVELGTDQDGDPITTCVVVEADAPAKTANKPRLSPELTQAYRELCDLFASGAGTVLSPLPDMAPKRCVTKGEVNAQWIKTGRLDRDSMQPNTLKSKGQRLRESLRGAGLIGMTQQYVWALNSPNERGAKGA